MGRETRPTSPTLTLSECIDTSDVSLPLGKKDWPTKIQPTHYKFDWTLGLTSKNINDRFQGYEVIFVYLGIKRPATTNWALAVPKWKH